MRKVVVFITFLFVGLVFVHADDVTKDINQLPEKARTFIREHFSNHELSYIKIDKEMMLKRGFDVVFTNGVKIEFNRDGEWKEIDGESREIPSTMLPANARNYVQQNFSTEYITKIEKKSNGYEVELNNDLTLKFTTDGHFRKLED